MRERGKKKQKKRRGWGVWTRKLSALFWELEIRVLWWISITIIIQPFISQAEGGRVKNSPLLVFVPQGDFFFSLKKKKKKLSPIEMHIPSLLTPVTVAFPAGSQPPPLLPP